MADQTPAEYLSLSEVAGFFGVSERTVYRWIKAGGLKAYKPGRDYRIPQSAVREFMKESEITPKGRSRSLFEPSLNDLLEEERREAIYGPWLEAITRYADRWEQRIETGNFDMGNVSEFIATLEDLGPTLSKLEAEEREQLPQDQWGDYHENLKMNVAIGRLMSLFNPLIAAGTAKLENTQLEQLRRKRAEQEAAFGEPVRRGA